LFVSLLESASSQIIRPRGLVGLNKFDEQAAGFQIGAAVVARQTSISPQLPLKIGG
jgi:hypothetical protein